MMYMCYTIFEETMNKTVIKRKPLLFSYRMTHDTGLAPNPFGGICTLALCKPVIRRVAEVGDWIVGTGSADYDFENSVIYAMLVTNKMTFEQYDKLCTENDQFTIKIPHWEDNDDRKKVGDCIYNYSMKDDKGRIPSLRKSVHEEINRETNLGGLNVLLSNHFYYFGKNPQLLPSNLQRIIKKGQGHRSTSNEPFKDDFVKWIERFVNQKNNAIIEPFLKIDDQETADSCSRCQIKEDKEDLKIRKNGIC